MVGPRVYHVHQTRHYTSFANSNTAFEAMNSWLRSSDFNVRRKSPTFSKGSKRGVHVNFVPKFKLLVEPCKDGSYLVKFDYYGKMKIGTLVVVGILTSGISTAVGVATYAMRLLEADEFAGSFWAYVDSLARGSMTVVKVERWGHDGRGNYVQQPAAVQAPPVSVQQPVVLQQPYAAQPYGIQQQPYGVQQQSYGYAPQPYAQQQYAQTAPPALVKSREIPASAAGYPGNYSSPQSTAPPPTQLVYPTYASDQHHVYGHPEPAYYPQTQYAQPPPLPHQSSQKQLRLQDEHPQMYYPVLEAPQPYYPNHVDAHASAS